MKIGAQFYTIRDACKDLAGLEESLKKVADIGYRTVQLSGICDYEPEWMAQRLKENGLTADITHFNYLRYAKETEAMIRHHDIICCKYMGTGGFDGLLTEEFTEEKLKSYADLMAPAVEKIYESGHKFMYHNHNREFHRLADGRTVLEHICDCFPAEKMGITLDTYWVQAGGADPAEWIYKLKGRVDCAHFKDMDCSIADASPVMAPIGDGNMNYDAILKACLDTGVEFGYVEQDNCNGVDPFVCLKRSFDYFHANGLC